MTSNVCSPWVTVADLSLCETCPQDDVNLTMMQAMMEAASSILNKKCGYLWPGLCDEYVRPCSQFGNTGLPAWHGDPWEMTPWSWWLWLPSWGVCGCGGGWGGSGMISRGCTCCGPKDIELGASPIASITEVKIDGDVLVEGVDYEIVDDSFLRRLNGNWPCCQSSAPDTDPDTFSVSFQAGADPPMEAKLAALSFACDLYAACAPGGDCALPVEVASMARENVDYTFRIVRMDELKAGFTGNTLADLLIAEYGDTQTEADVWSPDVGAAVVRPRNILLP